MSRLPFWCCLLAERLSRSASHRKAVPLRSSWITLLFAGVEARASRADGGDRPLASLPALPSAVYHPATFECAFPLSRSALCASAGASLIVGGSCRIARALPCKISHAACRHLP